MRAGGAESTAGDRALTYVVSIPVVIVSTISLVMRSSDLRGNDGLRRCLARVGGGGEDRTYMRQPVRLLCK